MEEIQKQIKELKEDLHYERQRRKELQRNLSLVLFFIKHPRLSAILFITSVCIIDNTNSTEMTWHGIEKIIALILK